MERVKVNALAVGGDCIGEVISSGSSRSGKKIFLRGTIPGEIVEAEVVKEERNFLTGSLLKVIEPSPFRESPPCPYFERCGGCDLQHMSLAAQREAKCAMVESMLRLQAGVVPQHGVVLRGEELPGLSYRNRIALHVDRQGLIGFYRGGSGEVVPIERCLLASDGLNKFITKLVPFAKFVKEEVASIHVEEHGSEAFLVFKLREDAKEGCLSECIGKIAAGFENCKVTRGERALFTQYHGKPLEAGSPALVPFGHFSQVNAAGNRVLANLVCENVSGSALTELYAGAGNFSFSLAANGAHVAGVEVDAELVRCGRERAASEGASTVTFFQMSCEQYVRTHKLSAIVVLDPPRSGARAVCEALDPAVTVKVVYVSCNLPSFCRDLKILKSRGYRCETVFVVDMFPQTHHVEMVAVL